jgi:hypothetical protein
LKGSDRTTGILLGYAERTMPTPSIEIIGVYRLPLTDQLVEEQAEILFGAMLAGRQREAALAQSREQLSSVVMIEALVRNRNPALQMTDFVQSKDGEPKESWQVAWAEAYLTADGLNLAVERWSDPPASGDLRVAFFMHFWQEQTPLQSSYGEIACPTPTAMPSRLAALVPYEIPD